MTSLMLGIIASAQWKDIQNVLILPVHDISDLQAVIGNKSLLKEHALLKVLAQSPFHHFVYDCCRLATRPSLSYIQQWSLNLVY